MKIKKIPMRMCVITRERFPKMELIRVVRTPEGKVIVDLTGKANGKGAYLKKDLAVIEKAEKSKALDKILETEIQKEIYQELKSLI